MANVKITQLPSATTPLTGTEVFPLVQGTTTKQVAITGLFTSPVMTNPTLGTVGQADLINATGLPISTGVAGLGTGIATFLGTPSSANLRTAVTDETGTGALVFANAPVLVAPDLGTPTFLVATNATGTAVGLTAGSAITNANLTGAVTSVGNATSLGSFTSAQLRTALTDETGAGSAVFATSPTITAPILNQINDTNNAQILGLSPTTSAVDYLVVKNGTGVGVPLHFYADGSSANIGLHIQPKGTGLVTISDGTDFNKGIRFRSSSSAASAITLLDAVSTAGRVVTLPDATTTLVGRDTTDTLTNKTIAFSSNTFSGTLAIANGGTNASTAALAIENLLPAYAGNGSKGLKLNSGATALEWVADGGGTVTSVAATVPSFLSIAGSPITTSGTLAFTLSGTALPTTSGGTGLSSFTSGGVVYASSTSALATGSALTFDGTNFGVGVSSPTQRLETLGTLRIKNGNADSNGLNLSSDSGGIGYINAGYASVGAIVFQTEGTERYRLTSTSLYTASGINVGIGTSSPQGKLQVGSPNTSGSITIPNCTIDAQSIISGSSNSPVLSFNAYNSSYGMDLWVGTTGLSPGYIDIRQNEALIFRRNTASGTATETMRLDSAGSLLVGTTTAPTTGSLSRSIVSVKQLNDTYYTSGIQIEANANTNVLGIGYNGSTFAIGATYRSTGGYVPISFSTSDIERMRIDTSGNVGIGTSSPNSLLSLQSTSVVDLSYNTTSTGAGDLIGRNLYRWQGTDVAQIRVTAGTDTANHDDAFMSFFTSDGTFAERARITSAGVLLVNTTALLVVGYEKLSVSGTIANIGASGDISNVISNAGTGSQTYVNFSIGSGATTTGTITTNGTTTAYNITSDQRLKENIQDADSASSLIDSLQVRKFDWKSDNSHQRYGFVAQELAAIAPEAVHQPTNTDEMMAVDYSKLVPMLVKEIQSLRQRVAQLETN